MSELADLVAGSADAWWRRVRTPFTDEGVSTFIAEQLRGTLCYVPGLGWHRWSQISTTCGYWEDLGPREPAAREHVAAMLTDWVYAVEGDTTAWANDALVNRARRYLTYGSINATIRALEAKLATDVGAFDSEAHLISTPEGVLDLGTLECVPAKPSHLSRKMANLSWNPDLVAAIGVELERTGGRGTIDAYANALDACGIDAPRWTRFLLDTFGDDDDLADYVWALIGSCCYGDGPREMMHVVVGSGANGKSVLWNTVMWFLGGDGSESYAAVAPRDAIILTSGASGGRGLNTLWTATGCRLLFFPELPYGKVDESAIKALASGEPMFLNKKFVDERLWRNTGKLVAHTNTEPRVSQGQDGGLWRRMRIVPHSHVVPPDQQEYELAPGFGLADVERAEVASWIVAAANAYAKPKSKARKQMAVAPAVAKATTEYRFSEDHVSRFIADCLVVVPYGGERTTCSDVYKRYKEWSESEGLRPLTQQHLTRQLSTNPAFRKGVDLVRHAAGRVWKGVEINRAVWNSVGDAPVQEEF
jgi:P4 family phage/plasmid primase-like protien